MVKKLLAPKREGLHPDYELGHFERCAAEAFTIDRSERLASGTRVLFLARPKRACTAACRPHALAVWRGAALRATLWDYAHLAALSSLALAEPLFALLRRSPEFLAARGALGFDVVSFAVILVALPPALVLAVELLAGLIDHRARRGLHLAFVAGLAALVAAQALKRSVDAADGVLIALAAAVGIGAAVAYARVAVVRSFMNVLSAAPIVFLCLFLFPPSRVRTGLPEPAGRQVHRRRSASAGRGRALRRASP